MTKRLLLIIGPQGSGNHLWAKIFASDPEVYGWDFKGQFWDGHHNEPFNEFFLHPEKLGIEHFPSDYNVASVSVPFVRNKKNNIPLLDEFIDACAKLKVSVTVAVVGRDRNILSKQQIRLRGGETFHLFLRKLRDLHLLPQVFLSMELLNLYREYYLEQLSFQLNWPIEIVKASAHIIDTNEKYVTYVDTAELDLTVKRFLAES